MLCSCFDRIWPSFDGHLSVFGRTWQKRRKSGTKLEALLTTVRRWGCEALSNLWSHANGENIQTQTYRNNECETSEGATAMTQAKTHTHIRRQHDYGRIATKTQTRPANTRRKMAKINTMRNRRQTESGNPTKERGVDESNKEQSQNNLSATAEYPQNNFTATSEQPRFHFTISSKLRLPKFEGNCSAATFTHTQSDFTATWKQPERNLRAT